MKTQNIKIKDIKSAVITMILILCLGAVTLLTTGCASSKDKEKELLEEEGIEYMSYEGPIFPITATGDIDNIRVEREVHFDFQDMSSGKVAQPRVPFLLTNNVKDSYQIANDTDETLQVRFCYPSSGKLSYMANSMPYIAIDGERIDTELFVGASLSQYFMAFTMSGEEKNYSEREFTSWKQYKELLETDDYYKEALEKDDILDKTVTVYQLSNETVETQEDNGATLAFEFFANDSNTEILTYGINLLKNGVGNDKWKVGYSMPQNINGAFRAARYLVVVGSDIGDYKIQGYKDGTCTAGTELKISADVKRYETTLGKILEEIFKYHNSIFNNKTDINTVMSGISSEDLAALIADFIWLDDKASGEKQNGAKYFSLEDAIGETMTTMRIFYQTFSVEIPAKTSIRIDAIMYKTPSKNNQDDDKTTEKAFDLVTQIGTNLIYSSQRATIKNLDSIEISKQNFGFDIGNNVASVDLKEGKEYFFLEVKVTE